MAVLPTRLRNIHNSVGFHDVVTYRFQRIDENKQKTTAVATPEGMMIPKSKKK